MKYFYIVILILALVGCTNFRVEAGAMTRLDAEVADMGAKYLKYVEADPVFGGGALTPEQRQRARANEASWVERVRGLSSSLKRVLEN